METAYKASDDDDAPRRYREQPAPWQLHAIGLGLVLMIAAIAWETRHRSPREATFEWFVCGSVIALIAWDHLRCRRIAMDRDGIGIAGKRFAWRDLEVPHFRETPLARAGMFLRLSDEARTRLGLPPPRHRIQGIGLDPPPGRLGSVRYDFFLRAREGQLAQWQDVVMLHLLAEIGSELRADAGSIAALPRPPVEARVISGDDVDGGGGDVTIELRADSIEALLSDSGKAVASALPSRVRWSPDFAAGIIVLVAPAALGNESRAEATREHIVRCVRESIAGKPRAIEVVFAERAAARA
jgi:hypothetical protein